MNDATHDFRPIDRAAHTLLIVDDEPASRYSTCRVLSSAGFRIREAATGQAGLDAVTDDISAMIVDVHLPDIDGFELCRRLRSRDETRRLPVLHLTAAFVTDEDKVRGLDSGADAYLTRPVEPGVLVATVQALVRTRIAEEAMRLNEAKFRAIYEQAPSGIALLDGEGRVVKANPAMLRLLGRAGDEVSGRALTDFVPASFESDAQSLIRNIDAVLTGVEIPIARPDGAVRRLDCSVSAQDDGGTLLIATDVSDRLDLDQQRAAVLEREQVARNAAEQVSRMKDDLIAVLSHELRTPLSAISGWTHVLQRQGGGEKWERGLAAIERNVLIQSRMISDLLDMSRLNLGKLPLAFETVDPVEAVQSAVSAMQVTIQDKGIVLDLRFGASYRPLRADGARMQQIIWNLMTNAIKFSEPGGRIEVALVEDPQGLTLRVRDEGRGIPASFLPFVFDRFAQNDAASVRRSGGLGLGLSIVKQLVEAHGGRITASSAGEGHGSTFEVWLPAAADGAEGSAHDEGVPTESGALQAESAVAGLRVMVVDDDREATAMLKLILSDRGAVVHTSHDVESALAQLGSTTVDLLLSDIGMPGRDGYALVRAVRASEAGSARHLPAIALTAFNRGQDAAQALAAGFDAHCAKPLRPLQLFQMIGQVLKQT